MAFISGPDGDLKTAFVSDSWLLDQFVGNTLFTWGKNSYGNLGDNTTTNKSNPVQTVTGGINWKQVSCNVSNTLAIKTDGTLWAWGQGIYGQLGDNTATNKSSPVQTVTGGTNWKQVCAIGGGAAAIKTDGTLWCWGWNGSGQLGDNTITPRSSPVQTIAFGTNWKQVSAGTNHVAAIKTDGTLWCWGLSFDGQLGNNNSINTISSPVQTVAFGTNWKQLSCGKDHTTAIKNDGTLWVWGKNVTAQLGDNTTTSKSSPIQTIAFGTNWNKVFAGYAHSGAIKTDGTLWCWGTNGFGQLGDNTYINKSSPVQTVTFSNNWKQGVIGQYYTTAIKTDGTLWTWGRNNSGQLGDNTIVSKSSPVQTTAYGTNWKQVFSGYEFTAAITNGDI